MYRLLNSVIEMYETNLKELGMVLLHSMITCGKTSMNRVNTKGNTGMCRYVTVHKEC